jgi:uncharacterized repeat protein (TIGR04052 family)
MMSRPFAAVLLTFLVAAPVAAQSAASPVTIRFAATVNGTPAACGMQYEGVGVSRSIIRLVDFRFYVTKVRLLKAGGGEVPVALTQDGLWQLDDVALVDFEDGTAGCANGTEQTRDFVEGTVPAGDYAGLGFEMALPFDKNHREPTLQRSPLNLSRMFWSWNAGYKFMRLDIRSTGQPKGWMVHLGSTGCLPSGTPQTVPESCTHRNAVVVDLPGFSVATDVVELDLGALLAASNVDENVPKSAAGCMSGQNDPDCGPLFEQLGLAFGEKAASPQKAFRVRRAATAAR